MKRYVLLLLLMCLGVSEVLAAGLKAVKYIVTSKTSVLAEGDEPIGSMATFEQTGAGQKGQMTAGNSTTFLLTGLNGIRLTQITLEMRSNKESGAGSMQITVGDQSLCTLSDAPFAAWYGGYTNSFVPITVEAAGGYTFLPIEEGGDGTTLQIYIEASENSLYIASYTLLYSTEPAKPYTVHFQTNSTEQVVSLTEEAIGVGVALPDCNAADSIWSFKGWTAETIAETDKVELLPTIYEAGERFYPVEDTQLYALYTDKKESVSNVWVQDTIFESGYYLIADSLCQKIAIGDVTKGKVPAADINLRKTTEERLHIYPNADYDADMVYYIDFLPDSMATIQHVTTERYVGYPAKVASNLTADTAYWNYRVTPLKQVQFYHPYDSETYRYFVAISNSNVTEYYWSCNVAHHTHYANILFNIMDAPIATPDARYTSFPLGTNLVAVDMLQLMYMPWGIKNEAGKPLSLYTLDGCLLMTTCGDIYFDTLQSGYYLMGVVGKYRKIYVP